MAFIFSNPNPENNLTDDCAVRAISIAFHQDWHKTYIDLAIKGFEMGQMPSSIKVVKEYLKESGWKRHHIPETCPDCYTVKDFCGEYFKGTYILGTWNHVVAVIDGDYYDSWDSGEEYPIFYWSKED